MDDVRRQFETNVFGLVRLTQLVLPGMRAQRYGKVVNVSSMGANFTFPGGGFYHATKYALEAISDALRFEVKALRHRRRRDPAGHHQDRASATPPSPRSTRAPRTPARTTRSTREVAKATHDVYEKGPMARLGGGPEDVAKTIERAITTRRPKIRYRVTPSAHMLVTQRALMTDGMWDAFLRTQFDQPGKD